MRAKSLFQIICLLNCISILSCIQRIPFSGHKPGKTHQSKPCNIRCAQGYHLTKDCRCVQNTVCIALACPEGMIRVPPLCKCVKKKDHRPRLPPRPKCQRPKNCQIQQCYPGYHVCNQCKCTPVSNRMCRKACPPGQTIRPGKCECVPIRKCQIKSCKEGFIVDKSKCACVKKSSSLPPSNQCKIASCDPRYQLNQQKCKCEVKIGIICLIGCPPGMRVFPGKCKCVYPPRCPIKTCKNGFKICGKSCKCVASKPWNPSDSFPDQWTRPRPLPVPLPYPYPFYKRNCYRQIYNPFRLYNNILDKNVSPNLNWAHRQIKPYRQRRHYLGTSK